MLLRKNVLNPFPFQLDKRNAVLLKAHCIQNLSYKPVSIITFAFVSFKACPFKDLSHSKAYPIQSLPHSKAYLIQKPIPFTACPIQRLISFQSSSHSKACLFKSLSHSKAFLILKLGSFGTSHSNPGLLRGAVQK